MLVAKPLRPSEQAWVAGRLGAGPGQELFWAQPIADQRHAHDVARFVSTHAPDRLDLPVAALLHDVGKRHARLGAVGRTIATLLRLWPTHEGSRFGLYNDHGPVGARELEHAGFEGVVVGFAAAHHMERPAGMDPRDWALLVEGDHER